MLLKASMGDILTSVLVTYSAKSPLPHSVVKEGCNLLRGLCLHDDMRKEMSCAYENGRLRSIFVDYIFL